MLCIIGLTPFSNDEDLIIDREWQDQDRDVIMDLPVVVDVSDLDFFSRVDVTGMTTTRTASSFDFSIRHTTTTTVWLVLTRRHILGVW
jgi:hypothetical protein